VKTITLAVACCTLSLGFPALVEAGDCAGETLDRPMFATEAPAEAALAGLIDPAILLASPVEPRTWLQASVSAAGSCYTACYDLDTSEEVFGCPPGQNFAMEATGPFFACCLVSGGSCVSQGCDVLANQCRGFASSCGGAC
jgi:hypothetical protein